MKAARTVDDYLAGVPEPARTTLEKLRSVIRSATPAGATEKISYGMPAFFFKKNVVAYAAFAKHCSFFPMSLAVIDKFHDELQPYLASKGTLHFPVDKLPPSALVKKIVKARISEIEAKR